MKKIRIIINYMHSNDQLHAQKFQEQTKNEKINQMKK